ncbi:MAG: hypothetical protein K2J46_05875 [Muribaculaceae bacterium]|nr:hypothetical protein [Muribaculaceae bacterium]
MKPYEMQWSSATPGLLIILVDQSGSMLLPYEGNDSKTVFATKAVNRVIDTIIQKNFDGESPKNRCFITVIGYNHDVKKLCSGYLKDLDANPLRVDTIKKKESDGAGGIITVDYPMPVWIEPITKDGATNMKGAFEMAKAIIEQWIKDKPNNPAPVIINISDGVPYYDGKGVEDCMTETINVAKDIMNHSVNDGNVLIFNAMISAAGKRQEFPASLAECTNNESKFLFEISSEVPNAYKAIAEAKELNVKEGSRGCIFEADEVQLVSLIDFGSSKGQRDI